MSSSRENSNGRTPVWPGAGPVLTRAQSRRPATHQRAESQSLVPPRVHEALRAGGRRNRVLASPRLHRPRAGEPRNETQTPCSPGCSRATNGSSAVSSPTPGEGRKISRRWRRGRLRWPSSSGVRTREVARGGLRSGGRRPVRGPRGWERRQRCRPLREGSVEFAVAELVPSSSWCWATRPAVRSRPRSLTSTPMTLCLGPSATSSRSSGRPPQRSEASLVTSSKTLSRPTWRWALSGSRAWTRSSRGWSRRGSVKVVGAVYKLRTGVVELLD